MDRLSSKNIRQEKPQQLRELLVKQREHLRDLYFRLSGAQLKNIQEIRTTKRNIATILTLIKENEEKK